MTTTSRRAVLIGAAALSAAPAVALARPTDQEHDLRVAYAEFQRASERTRQAGALMSQIGDSIVDPPRPSICEPPAALKELWTKITERELAALSKDHPLRVWHRTTAKDRRAAEGAWRAECRRLSGEHGYSAAEAVWEQCVADLFEAFKRVLATPAHSLAGLALKVRVVDEHDGENADYKDGWLSISADIRRLGSVA